MVDAVMAASDLLGKDFGVVSRSYTWRQVEMMAGYVLKRQTLSANLLLGVVGSALGGGGSNSPAKAKIRNKLPRGYVPPARARIIDLDDDASTVKRSLAAVGILKRGT